MTDSDLPSTASTSTRDIHIKPTGAGAEAMEGIHGALGHGSTGGPQRTDNERPGTEPLPDGTWIHESGYGGNAGQAKTSSDQREPREQEATPAADLAPPHNAP